MGWMQVLVGVALIGLAVPLAWRLIYKHLLWSLRNKLILTYLLIGLAPVVLFVTLVTILSYVAAGQFSIHLADSRMRQELDQIGEENSARAERVARVIRASNEGELGPPPPARRNDDRRGPERGPAGPRGPAQNATPANSRATTADTSVAETRSAELETALSTETLPDPLRARLHPHSTVYLNGAPLQGPGGPPQPTALSPAAGTPLGLPPWATDLRGQQIRYLVLDGGDLYLVAIDQRQVDHGVGLVTVVTSLPVDTALLDYVARGLGRVHVLGLVTDNATTGTQVNVPREVSSSRASSTRIRTAHGSDVYGGTEPFSVNICDFRVSFLSTLDTTDWDTGQAAPVPAAIQVLSRPSLLYRQLFGPSLGGVYTNVIRDSLIGLCVVFFFIWVLALWAAASSERQHHFIRPGTLRRDAASRSRRLHASHRRYPDWTAGPVGRVVAVVQQHDRLARAPDG